MHWRFDPLFSIEVHHSKYDVTLPAAGDKPRPPFALEATRATAARLREMGWVFKARAGACTVFGEKVFDAEGTPRLRAWPAPEEGLSFWLRLKDAALLNETKPYVLATKPRIVPNENLPAFSGRSRLLYFDSRETYAAAEGQLYLGAVRVGSSSLASIAPPAFSLSLADDNVRQVALAPLRTAGESFRFSIPSGAKTVPIELPEAAYRLEQQPGGQAETIVLNAEQPTGNILGMVRIFAAEDGAWEPVRRYTIFFEGTDYQEL
jgi:hypothetical protein